MSDENPINPQFNQKSSAEDAKVKISGLPNQSQPKLPEKTINPVARPVSKQQIDNLYDKLKTPRIQLEHTPMGATTRQVTSKENQEILKEIVTVRQRLEMRRNAAKQAFNRARIIRRCVADLNVKLLCCATSLVCGIMAYVFLYRKTNRSLAYL